MKIRKNMLAALLAGLLAMAGVACEAENGGTTDGASPAPGLTAPAITPAPTGT